jgi:hypothetical protein
MALVDMASGRATCLKNNLLEILHDDDTDMV